MGRGVLTSKILQKMVKIPSKRHASDLQMMGFFLQNDLGIMAKVISWCQWWRHLAKCMRHLVRCIRHLTNWMWHLVRCRQSEHLSPSPRADPVGAPTRDSFFPHLISRDASFYAINIDSLPLWFGLWIFHQGTLTPLPYFPGSQGFLYFWVKGYIWRILEEKSPRIPSLH